MKDNRDQSLREVIEELIKAYRWEGKLDVVKLKNSWQNIVGTIIANHTTKLEVRNKTLYIKLDSSVIRNELMMARTKIIEAINKEMGSNMIKEIVLL